MDSEPNRERGHRHVVARADDIPAGGRKVVTVEGREIGIFNLGGELHALRNICPHRSGPLCLGRQRPLVIANGFDVAFDREGEIVKCPWHQWEFDIRTGRCMVDPTMRVRSYRAALEGNDVVLYT